MKETLARWFAQPLPGLAAWGARLADRSLVSGCCMDWFTSAQVEQALSRMALAAENLGQHGIHPARLCWVFEHARVHLARRPDGACLALIVQNRPGLPTAALNRLLDQFLSHDESRLDHAPKVQQMHENSSSPERH